MCIAEKKHLNLNMSRFRVNFEDKKHITSRTDPWIKVKVLYCFSIGKKHYRETLYSIEFHWIGRNVGLPAR